MGSLADVTLGDIGRALARYRPVAVTVAIILVVLAVVPGPRGGLRSLGTAPPPPAGAATNDASAGAADTAPVDTTAPGTDTSSSTFDSSSSSFSSPSSSPSSSFDSSPSDFSNDDSSFSSSEPPKPTSDLSDEDFSSPGASASSLPLTIVAAGWASAAGGTPIGSTGVTEGTLPVGKRIGQVDKYSYVRLEGDQLVLTLALADAGRTTTGAVGVSICQITEADWAEDENVPSDSAPEYDTATCVKGDPGDGTAWTFNLVTFASPTDARGFALVPTGDSIDYQVNFKRSA